MPDQTIAAAQPAVTSLPAESVLPGVSPATRAVLLALKTTTGDKRLPVVPGTGHAAAVLTEIHAEQATAAWRQLLRRYATVDLRTRHLNRALIQAGQWVTELTAPLDGGMDELAHAAVVAALARRLIIDGPLCARAAVTACADAITTVPATPVPTPRDGTRPLTTVTGT